VQAGIKSSCPQGRRNVRISTPELVALSPAQEREAAALLGQLLLDAAGKQAGSVFEAFWPAFPPALSTAPPDGAQRRKSRVSTENPAGERTPTNGVKERF
jgi:hypothetical protein